MTSKRRRLYKKAAMKRMKSMKKAAPRAASHAIQITPPAVKIAKQSLEVSHKSGKYSKTKAITSKQANAIEAAKSAIMKRTPAAADIKATTEALKKHLPSIVKAANQQIDRQVEYLESIGLNRKSSLIKQVRLDNNHFKMPVKGKIMDELLRNNPTMTRKSLTQAANEIYLSQLEQLFSATSYFLAEQTSSVQGFRKNITESFKRLGGTKTDILRMYENENGAGSYSKLTTAEKRLANEKYKTKMLTDFWSVINELKQGDSNNSWLNFYEAFIETDDTAKSGTKPSAYASLFEYYKKGATNDELYDLIVGVKENDNGEDITTETIADYLPNQYRELD